MNIEMNNKLPEFNAEIGKEFDYQSVYLKTTFKINHMFVVFLFLGAGYRSWLKRADSVNTWPTFHFSISFVLLV